MKRISSWILFFVCHYDPVDHAKPFFDPHNEVNVSVVSGKTAFLRCRVRNLGNKTVSWIRHRDVHILSSGPEIYVTDRRFNIYYDGDGDTWTLNIKYAHVDDSGYYECQISTLPIQKQLFRLNVIVAEVLILGADVIYVNQGSTINLTCVIKFTPDPPEYLFWYYKDRILANSDHKRRVEITTRRDQKTVSSLLIRQAQRSDSGEYTCSPSNTQSVAVKVHVIKGDIPAAMQSSGYSIRRFVSLLTLSLVPALGVTR